MISSFLKRHFFISSISKLYCTKVENRQVFPFTAIIGQTNMKLALSLNIIDKGPMKLESGEFL